MLYFCFRIKFKYLLLFVLSLSFFCIIQIYYLLLTKTEEVVPQLLWWTPFMPNSKERSIDCFNGQFKCTVSNHDINKTYPNLGAFLFYGSHIENHNFPLPRNNNILWAIFHEESPKNYAPFLFKNVQDLFNLTSTFSRYSDFPVTLQYLNDINLLTDKKYFVPTKLKNHYLEKHQISPILYIQSDCDTPLGRDELIKELGKYVKIDSYGKCLNNKKLPLNLDQVDHFDLYNEEILHFIAKYKFVIAFENAVCHDYITEKLWKPLIAGAVPIYFGSPNVQDFLPNKNSAILFKDFNNLNLVSDFINKVNNDDASYEQYLKHKLFSEISNEFLKSKSLDDHPILSFECFVCQKVHEKYRSYHQSQKNENIYDCPLKDVRGNWDQHWEIGKCQSKALEILVKRNKPFSEENFQETWETFLRKKQC